MKTFVLIAKGSISIVLLAFFLTYSSFGATFTATSSGNFSSSTTWSGGTVPPLTNVMDMIVIPSGINVNLDNTLTINGALASIAVEGTLTTTNSASLSLVTGTLSGAGVIILDTVDMKLGSALLFTGSLTANTLNSLTNFQSSANVTVNQTLHLTSGILTFISGGKLIMGSNSTIVISGGLLAVGAGGSVGLTANYNVTYTGNSSSAGVELSGSGLQNVTVQVDSGKSVTLTSDLAVSGTLSLKGGTLMLAGKNLTINGSVIDSAGGSVSATATSNVTINSSGGTTGIITFNGAGSVVNNLIVNVGSGNHAKIGGTVTVNGNLQLNGGTLNFNSTNLTLKGTITGSGNLSANSLSNLTVNTTSGGSTSISFASGGQLLNDLSISSSAGNSVSLASSLTVNGMLALNGGGAFKLNGNALTIGAAGSITGTDSIISNTSSDLIINSTIGISSLNLTGGIRNLTINSSGMGTVTIANNLDVSGTLSLQNGSLALNGKNLTINGNISAGGTGTISSTASSNITVNTTGGTTGAISFNPMASTVNNLTVNVGSGNQTKISGKVTVNGTLQLTAGILNFNNSDLTLKGSITGEGTLSANDSSNLILGTTGNITLNFASGGQVLKNLSISPSSGSSVMLASSLTINGMLSLNGGGTLNLNGNALTLGIASSIAGIDSIVSNSSSDLTINSQGGISSLNITGGIRNLTVNSGSTGNVTLGNNLTISGILSLQSGSLQLNGKNLTIIGGVANSGSGTISSTGSSNVSINTTGGTVGIIAFNAMGSAVNNLIVNVGSGNHAKISGNLSVNGMLQVNSGILNFGNTTLTLDSIVGTGILSGNGSSNLTLNTTTGTTLTFAVGGQLLKNLSVSPSTGNSVSLGSPLTVNGMLSFTGGGTFDLNGNLLTLGEASSIIGMNAIVSNTSSDLTINATGGISLLNLTGGIRNLTINSGASGNVNLGNNLTVSGILSMQNGTLRLNGKDLTIAGNISAGGMGTISSDSTSDISISPVTSLLGGLRFSLNANTVGNLTVTLPNGGSANIVTDLNIAKKLNLMGGTLNIGANKLSIETSGSILGSSNSSYIITETGGSLGMNVAVGESNKVNFPIGTLTHYAPATVQLNSGLGSGQIHLGVVNDVKAQGTTGVDISTNQPVVDATWNISSDITANLDMNLKVMWSSAMEVNGFNRNSAYISRYVNGKWDSSLAIAATSEMSGMFSVERTGITSLSPFTVFDKTTTVVKESGNLSFEVYPNPTVDVIIIQNPTESAELITMDIYNSLGQLINSYKLTDPTSTISVRELARGNYFIKFSSKGVSSIRYFTKI